MRILHQNKGSGRTRVRRNSPTVNVTHREVRKQSNTLTTVDLGGLKEGDFRMSNQTLHSYGHSVSEE